jgi:hypothetical protein
LAAEGVEMIAPPLANRKAPKTQNGRPLRRYKRRWVGEGGHPSYPYPDQYLLSDAWPDRLGDSRHRRGKVPASGCCWDSRAPCVRPSCLSSSNAYIRALCRRPAGVH